MIGLVAACSLFTGAGAALLLVRLFQALSDGRARLKPAVAPDDFPRRLARMLSRSIDAGLLAEAGAGGLSDVPVRFREASDSYRTAGELIDWIARGAGGTGYAEVSGLIKGVYQLGQSLRATDGEVTGCLQPLLSRFRNAKVGDTTVSRVECIRPGTMLDPATMASLNYGARVVQPLGVLAYDGSGRVLGKAKVLCG